MAIPLAGRGPERFNRIFGKPCSFVASRPRTFQTRGETLLCAAAGRSRQRNCVEIRIRKARLPDVQSIVNVTREFGRQGIMIPLSLGDALERVRAFLVAELEDGRIIGCVAVDATWDLLVEIRSLAVASEFQKMNVGRRLVEAALREARDLGARDVFTLTYVPDFFARFGFQIIDRNTLPHKVWLVCVKCPKFPDCGETAMKRSLLDLPA